MIRLLSYEELLLKYKALEKKYLELINMIDEEFWDNVDDLCS